MTAVVDVQSRIDELWDRRAELGPADVDALVVVRQAIDLLDSGQARVAEVNGSGEVVVHQWLKQAILLLFRLSAIETQELGPFEYADKLPLKRGYEAAGVRVVPGASARWSGPANWLPAATGTFTCPAVSASEASSNRRRRRPSSLVTDA